MAFGMRSQTVLLIMSELKQEMGPDINVCFVAE